MKNKFKAGFSVVEILVVVAVVALLGFLVWRFIIAAEDTSAPASTSTNVETVLDKEVSDTDDLNDVEATINQIDIEEELNTDEIDQVLE